MSQQRRPPMPFPEDEQTDAVQGQPDDGGSIVPEFDTVRDGENFQQFAERNGVDPRRLMEMNDGELEHQARARGFSHAFMRSVPDEEGGAQHETGRSVRLVPDRHIFGGTVLRLRPPEKGDPDWKE